MTMNKTRKNYGGSKSVMENKNMNKMTKWGSGASKSRRNKYTRSREYKCVGLSYELKKKNMVSFFMEMLNTVKIYHWNTRSYAQHKATDDLYSSLNDNIDHFIEVLLGKKQDRISKLDTNFKVANLKTKKQLIACINKYICYLETIDLCITNKETDLLNIRDEILADLNKFKYLLTLE